MIEDRRTEEDKTTHTCFVVAYDKFMSGWGKTQGGSSYVTWACKPEHLCKVEDWVCGRGDMAGIFTTDDEEKFPRLGNYDHLSIYVVEENHPSLM